MSINWSDLMNQAGGIDFTPIPKGDYILVVDSATAQPAKTGKSMIKIRFKVEEGPYANRVVFHNVVLTPDNPNALVFFFRSMAAFGLSKEFFQMQPALETVAAQIVGKRVLCNVDDTRVYQGDKQNDVKSIRPVSGGPGGPAPTPAPSGSHAPVPPAPSVAAPTPTPVPQPPSVPPTPSAPASKPTPSTPSSPAPAPAPAADAPETQTSSPPPADPF